jgi:16S rRNA (adenine1518-N6/adenine1519-N6)-dimethyltransferase
MAIPAKKSLGQNFLTSKGVVEDMIEAAEVGSNDIILEAGPGKGMLTESLLTCAREVIAVEKDDRLVTFLQLKFREQIKAGKLKIIHEDILTFDPAAENLQTGGYKIVANLPYYITGEFLRHFLAESPAPRKMTLMLQKEVAQRICAKNGKESILSLSVKLFGKPKIIRTVEASYFNPKPKVDSAIIHIDDISTDFLKNIDGEILFKTIKVGFSKKRKKLQSNLSEIFDKEKVKDVMKKIDLGENTRAEDVPLSKWKILSSYLA